MLEPPGFLEWVDAAGLELPENWSPEHTAIALQFARAMASRVVKRNALICASCQALLPVSHFAKEP